MSADFEFDASRIQKLKAFVQSREILFKPRPARRHNKIGIVERKNRTLKTILERFQADKSSADDTTLLARSTFLSNCFAGSSTLSSFELSRGYTPSLIGHKKLYISEDLLTAHKQQAAVRALQRALRSRTPYTIQPHCLNNGDPVYYYFNTSSYAKKDEWRPGIIVETQGNFALISQDPPTSANPSKIAYEDLRIRPRSTLTAELMEHTVEHFMQLTHEGETDRPEMESHALVQTGSSSNANNSTIGIYIDGRDEDDNGSLRSQKADIGDIATNTAENPCIEVEASLTTDEQRVLAQMETVIGNRQVSSNDVQFAPPWLLSRAIEAEYRDNWSEAYIPVHKRDMPRDANIITSHWVFKIKVNEEGTRALKARLVIHGNHDDDKDIIRKDAIAANMFVTRLLISIGTLLGFSFGVADIKGAFMQSGPICRDLYVKAPKHMEPDRAIYWKLTKLPYGLSDASRQWLKVSDEWLLDLGFVRVFGINQLFILRDSEQHIKLMTAKTTDDFLIAGCVDAIETFFISMKERFKVGKALQSNVLQFNGCEINISETGTAVLSMYSYIKRLKPIQLSRSRRKDKDSRVNDREEAEYRSLAGTLIYLGSSVLPPAAYVNSWMQQKVAKLRVQHLIDANEMLSELLALQMIVTYRRPTSVSGAKLVSFSDAAHGGQVEDHGQSGRLIGLRIYDDGYGSELYHILDWGSHKQNRISHSSFGAEIIAAAEMDSRGYDLRESFRIIFPSANIEHEMIVDSKALFDTITAIHEAHEFRLRRTVTMIRHSFESKELDGLRWIQGKLNIADALTKRNVELFRRLDGITSSGFWKTPTADSKLLRSEDWS